MMMMMMIFLFIFSSGRCSQNPRLCWLLVIPGKWYIQRVTIACWKGRRPKHLCNNPQQAISCANGLPAKSGSTNINYINFFHTAANALPDLPGSPNISLFLKLIFMISNFHVSRRRKLSLPLLEQRKTWAVGGFTHVLATNTRKADDRKTSSSLCVDLREVYHL